MPPKNPNLSIKIVSYPDYDKPTIINSNNSTCSSSGSMDGTHNLAHSDANSNTNHKLFVSPTETKELPSTASVVSTSQDASTSRLSPTSFCPDQGRHGFSPSKDNNNNPYTTNLNNTLNILPPLSDVFSLAPNSSLLTPSYWFSSSPMITSFKQLHSPMVSSFTKPRQVDDRKDNTNITDPISKTDLPGSLSKSSSTPTSTTTITTTTIYTTSNASTGGSAASSKGPLSFRPAAPSSAAKKDVNHINELRKFMGCIRYPPNSPFKPASNTREADEVTKQEEDMAHSSITHEIPSYLSNTIDLGPSPLKETHTVGASMSLDLGGLFASTNSSDQSQQEQLLQNFIITASPNSATLVFGEESNISYGANYNNLESSSTAGLALEDSEKTNQLLSPQFNNENFNHQGRREETMGATYIPMNEFFLKSPKFFINYANGPIGSLTPTASGSASQNNPASPVFSTNNNLLRHNLNNPGITTDNFRGIVLSPHVTSLKSNSHVDATSVDTCLPSFISLDNTGITAPERYSLPPLTPPATTNTINNSNNDYNNQYIPVSQMYLQSPVVISFKAGIPTPISVNFNHYQLNHTSEINHNPNLLTNGSVNNREGYETPLSINGSSSIESTPRPLFQSGHSTATEEEHSNYKTMVKNNNSFSMFDSLTNNFNNVVITPMRLEFLLNQAGAKLTAAPRLTEDTSDLDNSSVNNINNADHEECSNARVEDIDVAPISRATQSLSSSEAPRFFVSLPLQSSSVEEDIANNQPSASRSNENYTTLPPVIEPEEDESFNFTGSDTDFNAEEDSEADDDSDHVTKSQGSKVKSFGLPKARSKRKRYNDISNDESEEVVSRNSGRGIGISPVFVPSYERPKSILELLRKVPSIWKTCLENKKGVFRCVLCEESNKQVFRHMADLARHIDQSGHHRSYKCNEGTCPWSIIGFAARSEWARHTKHQHLNEEFTCSRPYCNKKFARRDSYKRHMSMVHQNEESRYNKRMRNLKVRQALDKRKTVVMLDRNQDQNTNVDPSYT